MTIDEEPWGPSHGPDEPCLTSDRKPISVGMAIIDYDMKDSVVTERPYEFTKPEFYPYDPVCWSQAGHRGHWWQCSTGSFDGSRMQTTRRR